MSKKNIIILTVAIIIFLGALALFLYANSLDSGNKSENITNSTLNQSVTDSSITKGFYFYDIDGNKLNLDDFSDKPIAMLFWKSDDANSYEVIKLFEKYYQDYQNSAYFLVINVNEPDIDLEIVENVKAAKFQTPMYFDTDLTAHTKYQYQKLPYLIFMEEDGTISNEVSETITEDAFTANLDLIIHNY